MNHNRRHFLRSAAAAVAIGLSPVFLNRTRLMLPDELTVTLTIHKVFDDGTKELVALNIPQGKIVDNGVNTISYQPKWTETICEVGVSNPQGGLTRHVFDQPITVMDDERLEVVYDWSIS